MFHHRHKRWMNSSFLYQYFIKNPEDLAFKLSSFLQIPKWFHLTFKFWFLLLFHAWYRCSVIERCDGADWSQDLSIVRGTSSFVVRSNVENKLQTAPLKQDGSVYSLEQNFIHICDILSVFCRRLVQHEPHLFSERERYRV